LFFFIPDANYGLPEGSILIPEKCGIDRFSTLASKSGEVPSQFFMDGGSCVHPICPFHILVKFDTSVKYFLINATTVEEGIFDKVLEFLEAREFLLRWWGGEIVGNE
jgi:hypothetical protein